MQRVAIRLALWVVDAAAVRWARACTVHHVGVAVAVAAVDKAGHGGRLPEPRRLFDKKYAGKEVPLHPRGGAKGKLDGFDNLESVRTVALL